MRKNELKKPSTNEGLADLAMKAESDHEVQMARAELYKLAKYSIKLHEMLKGVSEREGLEGWVQSKITKAADYLGSVYHHLEYEQKFDDTNAPTLEGADYKHSLQKKLDEKTNESGLQRYTGIKKYGKKGFEELQKAGREGASEEEKGAIKDKHLPKKEPKNA
jgi:hypothetical protein